MADNIKLKKIYVLFLLFAYLGISSQISTGTAIVNSEKGTCGTILPGNYLNWKKTVVQTQNLVSTLKHDTCINKKFSIVFYVVLDSNYLWGALNPGNLAAAVDTLNGRFKRICVSFQNCSTVVIPHYPYNDWTQNVIDPIVTSNWYTTQTINFYLVNTVTSVGNPNAAGYAYMPGTPGNNKDVIVMRKSALNTKVLHHLIGHFFGLPDTYGEIGAPVIPAPPVPPPPPFSYEFVARTNCYTNGDGFCDTEADPYSSSYNIINPVCGYIYGPVDGNGKYYVPPVDNFMSEYFLPCRCRYTQEQYNFMARVMITSKFYLH